MTTNESNQVVCESGPWTIGVWSSYCDGEQLICGDGSGFQRITLQNNAPHLAVVQLYFSDGTTDEAHLRPGQGYTARKGLGTGVNVVAQC
ncbi:hypothetical protein [Alteraurantiacibacter buctensis]|uniref:hypothetical protein n=1 Tax=Alteraurantiacibacter buctensis TaxID=1503981 RepID=UPI001F3597CC|nr:hypothetical protein [Alteraurantiacibacter buctensis]